MAKFLKIGGLLLNPDQIIAVHFNEDSMVDYFCKITTTEVKEGKNVSYKFERSSMEAKALKAYFHSGARTEQIS